MKKPFAFGAMLLLTTNLVAPTAFAQSGASAGAPTPTAPPSTTPTSQSDAGQADQQEEEVEISTPGADSTDSGEIVVIGRNIPNVIRATPQVVSVLSAEDIARTGEGDIAGALTRVTGLSVVGNGFVFVRGLGDRYSSALLNGSPLPSPEPLRRTVPLDIFPTSVVGSALVQKTYSVNYPAEFGGGVINLTTKAIPKEGFVSIGGSVTLDTETTSEYGYTYEGGSRDWRGYDDGTRKVPAFIKEVGLNGAQIPADQVAQLANSPTTIMQGNYHIPANFSGELSLGQRFNAGDVQFGIVASAGISNSWKTRDAIQQDTNAEDGTLRSDYRTIITDNRAVVNGLLGLGAEFGDQTIRWTNVYIHDTVKQARGASATLYPNTSGFERFNQTTAWFERELFESQLVGEFKFDDLSLDVRGAYAKTSRNSPYERSFVSRIEPGVGWVNALNASNEQAQIAFSELDETLWSGQADLSYKLNTAFPLRLSAGYYYQDQQRSSSRFSFAYRYEPGGALPLGYRYLRPDLLLTPAVLQAINGQLGGCPNGLCLVLDNISGGQGAAVYDAGLTIHAGYLQADIEPLEGAKATIGVRYETAKEFVGTNVAGAGTDLDNGYWLPAATVTWNFAQNQQLRLHASKTIARPQFRELAPQFYQDFDSDRLFFGNPALVDSQLYNAEARYEWFFGRNERLTVAGFFKKIDNPIEQVSAFPTLDSRITTGFSYVPEAKLYGGEIELQKYVPLDFLGGGFFSTRRLLVVANYTYTKSSITADSTPVPDINAGPNGIVLRLANLLYRDGAPLTGQSDHLVNFQLGIEDTQSTSQVTLLVNYASDRVTARGASNASGVGFLPDVYEKPGVRLDLVARQGIPLFGGEIELKFEARNLTKTKFQEFQDFASGRRVYVNRWDQGRTFSLGATIKL
ncbi:TonB-dependent receptor domain-containing protein [Sphingomonas turrisvirgatae]|uniref:TonB-dependent receptor n=1 Tax=Sphingomonas turrisvirgatae TaxID=1888892 RepID=A0A1E3LSS2_9SPHN|nr:TonB-dependent receptor [Sphingomonas turrisvirgatae]ODP36215.1 TonB-dependent receptor [Sphingomonas turrisvirgatae]